jgi:hypothetical protein
MDGFTGVTTTAPEDHQSARPLSLMDDLELFDRIADAIHREDGLDRAIAGRALDQAILFLHAAGRYPDLGLVGLENLGQGW